MEQAWFEMRDVRRRRLVDAVWIPLRAFEEDETGRYGYLGYRSDLFAVGSLAIPLSKREDGTKMEWSDIGLNDHRAYAFPDSYKPADVYQYHEGVDLGVALILDQSFGGAEPRVWHLNQDLVIALGLLREDDVWVCPNEGYVEVARMKRNTDGVPAAIEIRVEFLRDYLAARQMALRLTTYRKRDIIVEDAAHITWPGGKHEDVGGDERFEGHVIAIHEGGASYGSETAVIHAGRTDVDPQIDVPVFGHEDDANTQGASWVVKERGRKLYRIWGTSGGTNGSSQVLKAPGFAVTSSRRPAHTSSTPREHADPLASSRTRASAATFGSRQQ